MTVRAICNDTVLAGESTGCVAFCRGIRAET